MILERSAKFSSTPSRLVIDCVSSFKVLPCKQNHQKGNKVQQKVTDTVMFMLRLAWREKKTKRKKGKNIHTHTLTLPHTLTFDGHEIQISCDSDINYS